MEEVIYDEDYCISNNIPLDNNIGIILTTKKVGPEEKCRVLFFDYNDYGVSCFSKFINNNTADITLATKAIGTLVKLDKGYRIELDIDKYNFLIRTNNIIR